MEISRPIELQRINEIKILSDARLIYKRDLNPIVSKHNLQVQFSLSGDLKGAITCYLCLDGQELSPIEKNYIFPLFVESMNILVGRQISTDENFMGLSIKLSPPKFSMNSKEINSTLKAVIQKYDLELNGYSFTILTEYSIEAVN